MRRAVFDRLGRLSNDELGGDEDTVVSIVKHLGVVLPVVLRDFHVSSFGVVGVGSFFVTVVSVFSAHRGSKHGASSPCACDTVDLRHGFHFFVGSIDVVASWSSPCHAPDLLPLLLWNEGSNRLLVSHAQGCATSAPLSPRVLATLRCLLL